MSLFNVCGNIKTYYFFLAGTYVFYISSAICHGVTLIVSNEYNTLDYIPFIITSILVFGFILITVSSLMSHRYAFFLNLTMLVNFSSFAISFLLFALVVCYIHLPIYLFFFMLCLMLLGIA